MTATPGPTPQPAQTEITREKLLIVEGTDAVYFISAALRHLGLQDAIDVRDAGGHSEWPRRVPGFRVATGFGQVKSIGLIRDAENDARAAFQSVCGVLRRAELSVPYRPRRHSRGSPTVSVFILPDCARPGMLETLCLDAAAADPAIACVDQFFDCLRERGLEAPGNMEKARLQSFLASRSEPGLLLGQAAQKGYWPWTSAALEPLLQFLRDL